MQDSVLVLWHGNAGKWEHQWCSLEYNVAPRAVWWAASYVVWVWDVDKY
jgi:hypothetical protein